MSIRAFSIAKHVARTAGKRATRVLRTVPPVEVLAEEWTERFQNKGKMKVLYLAVKYDYNNRQRGLSYEYHNFLSSIKQLDIELISLDIYSLHDLYGPQVTSKIIKEVAISECVDTIIYFHYLDIIEHDLWRSLHKEYGIRTVVWLSDDDVRYEQTKQLAACFSTIVTTIQMRHEQRLQLGLPSYHSQFMVNTKLYRPLNVPKTYDATFIGQKYGNREQYVEALRKNGISVHTFGAFWGVDSRLSQSEMIDVINRSKIMLNFSSSQKDLTKKYLKGRVFEIMSCGTLMLTEECEDLDAYATAGKDVVIFRDEEELIKKVKHFLANEEEREKIAKNGRQLVHKKYSFQDEFKRILRVA